MQLCLFCQWLLVSVLVLSTLSWQVVGVTVSRSHCSYCTAWLVVTISLSCCADIQSQLLRWSMTAATPSKVRAWFQKVSSSIRTLAKPSKIPVKKQSMMKQQCLCQNNTTHNAKMICACALYLCKQFQQGPDQCLVGNSPHPHCLVPRSHHPDMQTKSFHSAQLRHGSTGSKMQLHGWLHSTADLFAEMSCLKWKGRHRENAFDLVSLAHSNKHHTERCCSPKNQYSLDISRWTKYVKSRGTTVKWGEHAFVIPTVDQIEPEGDWASNITFGDAGLRDGDAGRAQVPQVHILLLSLVSLNTIVDLKTNRICFLVHNHSRTQVNGHVSCGESTDLAQGCQVGPIDKSDSSFWLKWAVECRFSHTTIPSWKNAVICFPSEGHSENSVGTAQNLTPQRLFYHVRDSQWWGRRGSQL